MNYKDEQFGFDGTANDIDGYFTRENMIDMFGGCPDSDEDMAELREQAHADMDTIKTIIINTDTNTVAGWSSTATADEPCAGHTAEIGDDVYDALDDSWNGARGTTEGYIIIAG